MKTSQRQHLKSRPFAEAVDRAITWLGENRSTATAIAAVVVIVGGGLMGYTAWRNSVESRAAGLLAEAMVIEESRVQPPAPPAGTTNDPTNPGGQLPGTYPTLDAKLEAALPKFMAAADAYPDSQAGQTARLHAADTLARMGRRDEALAQYDRVIAGGNPLLVRAARLGKSSVQLLAGQYDPAIATLKELADQKDGPLPVDGVLMELARAYNLAGRKDEAKATLTTVVEQHGESPYAPDARAELAKLSS